MAFASSLLPAPVSRVRASTAPELAASPPAWKGVSLAAARRRGSRHGVRAEVNESGSTLAVDALSQVKHVLLPVTDRNPYLSEGTRQAAATTASLAKKYGADITVVVIDDKPKESFPEHDTQMSSIRWHLSEGQAIGATSTLNSCYFVTVMMTSLFVCRWIYRVWTDGASWGRQETNGNHRGSCR
ncbi:hypothetical protein PVAP13_2NG455100 [Panicum virgatum]|uniref:Uncharacterized protein n=1 Tax=Panicum virgatum TaxID=38727 RepID=A0A8T0VMR4_PANVG|nr:hypothetical protein PVAP13_2NG455100 [Panicum virgatum]